MKELGQFFRVFCLSIALQSICAFSVLAERKYFDLTPNINTPTPQDVVAGDFDNDGDLDIVYSYRADVSDPLGPHPRLVLLRNNGNFTFATEQLYSSLNPYYSASPLAACDFNSDGNIDLFLGGSNNKSEGGLFRNLGNAKFQQVVLPIETRFEWDINSTDCGDYDHDGDIDLLMNAQIGSLGHVLILQNEGNFNFSVVDVAAAAGPISLAWIDIDGDKDLDIYASLLTDGLGGYTGALFRNDGSSGFVKLPQSFPASNFGSIAVADYDKDGAQDIAFLGQTYGSDANYRGYIYRNNRDGTFAQVLKSFGASWSSAQWADMDQDGNLDLLLANNFTLAGYLRHSLNQKFESRYFPGVPFTYFRSLAAVDLNKDGKLDLISTWPFRAYLGLDVFEVSGTVFTANNLGFKSIKVEISGAASGEVESDANGGFTYHDLVPGKYRFTPKADGMSFVPAFQEVTIVDKALVLNSFTQFVPTPSPTPTLIATPSPSPTSTITPVSTLTAADKIAPQLAIVKVKRRGSFISLKYLSLDDSGSTQEKVSMFAGKRAVKSTATVLSAKLSVSRLKIAISPKSRLSRVCMQAFDQAGNASALVCARVPSSLN